MVKEKINRINELAKKAKTVGLTPEEAEEQQALRQEYIQEFRAQFRTTLDHTVVQDPDGTRTPLSEYRSKHRK